MSNPLPEMMQAIQITRPGGPEVLKMAQMRRPEPHGGQILIEVAAAGINRPDILQRMGLYPPPRGAPQWPGLEVAGRVAATGCGAKRFKPGQRVCALLTGGGYAQYAVADEACTLPIPAPLDFVEAAALPEAFFTVWSNLFDRTHLKSGETVLIHGGASGIGTTAIQMARAMGAEVLASAGSNKKCAAIEKLGAIRAINYLEEDFVKITKELTQGRGADVILDIVAGDYIERNFKAAAIEGRIALIGFMGGSSAEVDFMPLLLKRLSLIGSTLRARSLEDKKAIAKSLEHHIWPLITDAKIKPVIDKCFRLEQAAEAHTYMEEGKHIGKIVLTA